MTLTEEKDSEVLTEEEDSEVRYLFAKLATPPELEPGNYFSTCDKLMNYADKCPQAANIIFFYNALYNTSWSRNNLFEKIFNKFENELDWKAFPYMEWAFEIFFNLKLTNPHINVKDPVGIVDNNCNNDIIIRIILSYFSQHQSKIPLEFYKRIADQYEECRIFPKKISFVLQSIIRRHRRYFRKNVIPQYLITLRAHKIMLHAVKKRDTELLLELLKKDEYFQLDQILDECLDYRFVYDCLISNQKQGGEKMLATLISHDGGKMIRKNTNFRLLCMKKAIDANNSRIILLLLSTIPDFALSYNGNQYLVEAIKSNKMMIAHCLYFHRNVRYFDLLYLIQDEITKIIKDYRDQFYNRKVTVYYTTFINLICDEYIRKQKEWNSNAQFQIILCLQQKFPREVCVRIMGMIRPPGWKI